jgi:phosphoribosylformimino-5-aminoimidazole carboxamide ribonucleotide (ProFAR) isomerase
MLILPAIDILGGKCVRLSLGKFDDATTYGDPLEQFLTARAMPNRCSTRHCGGWRRVRE